MSDIEQLIYAGHSAVFFKWKDFVIAVDPWLEGNPACPKHMTNPQQLDLIVLTHGHSDHAGDALRLAKRSNAKVAATYELAVIMKEEGVAEENIIYMNKGGTVEVSGVQISLTHAFHSNSYDSAKRGTLYAGEACGVIIKDKSLCVYHAGDTALFSDMTLIRETYQPKIGFLPIGDRFTMGPSEAAKAASILGLEMAIPIHFNTFPLLTGKASDFENRCKDLGVKCRTLEPGESINFN